MHIQELQTKVHSEKGPISPKNMRLMAHIILSEYYDFIPRVVIADQADYLPQSGKQEYFPVQDIQGVTIKCLLSDSAIPFSGKIKILLQIARQFQEMLGDGVFLPDRNGLNGDNIIIDRSGKSWQVDLEDAIDVVSGDALGKNKGIKLNTPERDLALKTARAKANLGESETSFCKQIINWCVFLHQSDKRCAGGTKQHAWSFLLGFNADIAHMSVNNCMDLRKIISLLQQLSE